jgi:dGTPase
VQSVEELQRLPHNVIGWSPAMAARNQQLKRFLFENLYRHHRVVRMESKAEQVLSDLFNAYLRKPAQLPPDVRKRADETGELPRAVCDYIAGMTDRFALDEHYKLFDPYTLP